MKRLRFGATLFDPRERKKVTVRGKAIKRGDVKDSDSFWSQSGLR